MRSFSRMILGTLLLLLFLPKGAGAAQVGDLISNVARIDYHISDLDKNLSTNEVNATVVQTDAKLEFLRYDPREGTPEWLEPTQYLDASGTPHSQPDALLPDGTTLHPPVQVGMSPSEEYGLSDLVIIRLSDLDRNTRADRADTIELNVSNPRTGEIETLILQETGDNSGVFVGYLQVDPGASRSPDGRMEVTAQDTIMALYLDNGEVKELTVEATIRGKVKGLLVSKKQSKDKASIGEYLKYTLYVSNQSELPIKDVLVEDALPPGVKYEPGSFKVQGSKVKPTLSPDGRTLRYTLSRLEVGQRVELSYVALIGAGIIDQRATNRAWASAPTAERSNIASVTLEVTEDLPRHKGYILGQVYDAEAWRARQEGNATVMRYGIPGVRLYMEDGRYVVTDQEGKYHFVDVKNGTHVVQIDEESIRGRYKVARCERNVRFAGKGRSQFVDIYHGEMRRVDFCLQRLEDAGGTTRVELELARESARKLRLIIRLISDVPIQTPELYLALPEGVRYEKNSLDNGGEPRTEAGVLVVPLTRRSQSLTLSLQKPGQGLQKIRGILYYNTKLEQDLQSDVVELSFQEHNGTLAIKRPKSAVTIQSVGAETAAKEGDFNWTQPTRQPVMPEYTPDEVDRLGKEPRIVWPPKGWIPTIPSARIAVLHSKKTRMKLSLNGRPVNPLNYEDRFRSSDRTMVIDYYKGVDLAEGRNRIVATILSRDGRVLRRLERVVYVESHAPVKAEFLPEYSWLIADGKHPPIVAVRFIGPSGHPLRGGLIGSFTTDGNTEPLRRENDRGVYRIDSEGIAYIRLKPTTRTGETRLYLKMADGKTETLSIRLKPQMREWIVVGFAEGTVGYRTLHGHSDVKKAAGGDEGVYTKGRIALFAKGQILGKWLMTLAYDTGRSKDDRRLFDAIDPDEYYTLYQDATTQGNEAPSRRKLYLKLERDQFTALFGDFHTGLDGTELSSYQRSFTGFWSEYAGSNLRAKGFVARTDRLHFRDDLPGDGTRGYYRLSHTPLIEGSEEVWIEVRDRHHPERVLSRRSVSRYTDYDIDYDKGTLYFKEPVYSRDEELNPQYIVVKYETEGEGSHYTYGGRLALRSDTGRYELGATYVDEGTGSGHNRLYGADLKVRINAKTTLKMELAHTRNSEEGNVTEGSAGLLEVNYEDENLSARAYYRQEDSDFGLGQLDPTLAGTRQMGVEGSWKLTERWSMSAQLYQNRSTDDAGEDRDTNVFESRLHYRNGPWDASAGYRYVDETDESVRHQITLGLSRSFLEDRLRLSLSHDQTLGGGEGGEYPTRTALKVKYRYDENTSMYANIERSRETDGTRWLSRMGMEYRPWKDGLITTGRLMESGGDDATRIYDTLGIKQRWSWQDRWKLSVGYEKGVSEAGDDEEFDAFNVAVDYNKEPYDARLGLGYRVGGGEKRFTLDSGFYIRHSKDLGLGFGLNWHQDWGDGSKSRDVEATFAFAYRPEITDWIVLDRFEIDDSYDKNDEGEVTQTTKFVNNLHLNWHPTQQWHIGLQYGLKYVVDTIDDERYDGWTDLAGFDLTYDFSEKLSLGVQGSVLHSYAGNTMDYGVGIFLSTYLWDNMELTVGYNFAGFDDDDFSLANYHFEGPYLRARMKFDQEDIKEIAKEATQ